ncbi:MAG TPA: alanine--tRNA ligase, partial [Candidatus Rifleibacterium sp.]|nr:alanine--tRNA ligase [Candidatus Rifleibacterium sp.]HPT46084.1 alanine--tRNA ligase [Candidatus Rifleibacterium sp.]
MKTATIRQKFLDFFGRHNHKVERSAPLIPQDDPTILFISAGMAPFKPYFLGLKKDLSRAASCQKCFRTTDIENVGYTARHHTFFEMLGNFSFGDYFKKEAIAMAWEFITKEVNLPTDKLYVSVHHSDDEALEIWHRDIGVPRDRIVKLGDKDNFWTIGVGPSGPCSEIYIDQGPEIGCKSPDCAPGCDCARFLEFWNLVFTQYDRAEDGSLTPLERKNIDTGMGLERLASILQGKFDNFENDVFVGIVNKVESLTGHQFNESSKIRTAVKVVSDHARALSFALADGALPGNEGRGYVLRKILRRASRFGYSYLGQDKPFLHQIIPTVAEIMSDYPEVAENAQHIIRIVKNEEERFLQTLKTGSEMLSEFVAELRHNKKDTLTGEKAFLLHDTYGFPLDLTREICREEKILVDETAFNSELEKQRERGRANVVSAFVNFQAVNPGDYPATTFTGYQTMHDTAKVLDVVEAKDKVLVVTDKSPFYAESGGQIGDKGTISATGAEFIVETTEKAESVWLHIGAWKSTTRFKKGDQVNMQVETRSRRATMRNHTATHLLHKALQEILGDHVKQAGSLVNPDRLRFDFTHFESIGPDVLEKIENRVNEQILEAHNVHVDEKSFADAVKTGAMALFGEKYGDRVRIISVGNYSKELCGGTHIGNSAEIGLFSIASESSIAAGVRRIEAVTGASSLDVLHDLRRFERDLARVLECDQKSLMPKAEKLVAEARELRRELDKMRKSDARGRLDTVRAGARQISGMSVILSRTEGLSVDEMKEISDELVGNAGEKTVVLLATGGDKAGFVLKLTADLVKKGLHAGKLIKDIAKIAGGSGGGRPDMATAGGKDIEKIDAALVEAEKLITQALAG